MDFSKGNHKYYEIYKSRSTHQAHTFGVDEPVSMDSPEAHVLPGLDVDRLVDGGHIGEG